MDKNFKRLQNNVECRSDYIRERETPVSMAETNNLLMKLIEEQAITNKTLIDLSSSLSPSIVEQRFDSGVQTLSTAVSTVPDIDDVSTNGYTRLQIYDILNRNAPRLYVTNLGPGALYIRKSSNGKTFTTEEIVIFEGGIKTLYDTYELRLRTPVANTRYIATEFDTILGQTYSSLNRVLEMDSLAINSGAAIPANGSAVQFDITGFVNVAKILQVTITQLTAGAANYTFEIWEKDSSGYNPSNRSDLYMRVYSRDFTASEDSDVIEPYIIYIDRDNTAELHCRLVNNVGGTASDFDVSIKALGNPL